MNRNTVEHVFITDEFTYTLSFIEMVQKNMDERYFTERKVRRRPEFQSAKDLQ